MEENQQRLRKAVSDASHEIDKYDYLDSRNIATIEEEVKQAECQCCGLKEECTAAYIVEVEDCYYGNWVCGLCSEAVKERLRRGNTKVDLPDAVTSHREFCQKYNSTTRLNPKLSFTLSMRDIAKRSSENRIHSKALTLSKLARSTSYP